MSWQWCKLVCRYWNRLVTQTHYPFLREAFLADLHHAVSSQQTHISRTQAWCTNVLHMLKKCLPQTHDAVCEAVLNCAWDDIPSLDVDDVLTAWRTAWCTWPEDPCDPRTLSGTVPAYWKWMSSDVNKPAST